MIQLKRARFENRRLGPDLPDNFRQVKYVSLLGWQEHCTECGAPDCFRSCDLYIPNNDLYCKRFKNGIEMSRRYSTIKHYSYKITFSSMGLLLSQGTIFLLPREFMQRLEDNYARLYWFYDLLTRVTSVFPARAKLHFFYCLEVLRRKILENLNAWKKWLGSPYPDSFRVDVYNPNKQDINCSLWIRDKRFEKKKVQFNKVLNMKPGFNQFLIDMGEIDKYVNLDLPFTISFAPNEAEEVTLYICCLDFVKHREISTVQEKPVKCLVLDLDNTLWDGILLEMLPATPKIKKGFVDMIKQLDHRGILLSIASKNDYTEVKRILEKMELWQYFLYPRINWNPKSQNLIEIAKDLNIGLDSLAFMDDSQFELAEVKTSLPEVLCVNAEDYLKIPEMEQFKGMTTQEGQGRRKLYMEQIQREKVEMSFAGNYEMFLKSCNIVATLFLPDEKVFTRIYELVQRTNQLNFSVHRYKKEELRKLMDDPRFLILAVRCQDKFGDYGIVGLNILSIERDKAFLSDAMFSCRIQAKKIEQSIFMRYINASQNCGIRKFYVRYVETDRNKAVLKILQDLKFKVEKLEGKSKLYAFDIERNALPEINYIKVIESVSLEDMIRKIAC